MAKFLKQRGTIDIFDTEALLFQHVVSTCQKQARLFNYKPIIIPTFESTALYTRSTGETSDIVTKEMYDFKDKGGRDIALRPEGTAGVIRSIVENKLYAINDLPLRYYYSGSFFRYERPQVGRYREFSQFGVEVVGSNSYLDDAETILLVKNILNSLNIFEYKVRINTFGNANCRNAHRDKIKEFLKDHIDNLCEDCKNRFIKNPLRILDCKVDKEYIEKLSIPVSLDALDDENKEIFEKTLQILKENDVNFEVDPYLVRGLDYYTGIIYEFDISLKDGKVLTIGGGGRYSSLVKELDGPDLSCVGFGLGINRLVLILQDLYQLEHYNESAKFYIMPFDASSYNIAMIIAQTLRMQNQSVVVETNNKSVGSMFKFASKHNFKYAIMIGEEELTNKLYKVKNLETKEQFFVSLDDIKGGKLNG
ncbi:MAG: histidine--tRNA ligase [Erysipelotrichaceae bacterium]|nr:histidine--tRNA ligase [Erysipelotrichaceae bacterium]